MMTCRTTMLAAPIDQLPMPTDHVHDLRGMSLRVRWMMSRRPPARNQCLNSKKHNIFRGMKFRSMSCHIKKSIFYFWPKFSDRCDNNSFKLVFSLSDIILTKNKTESNFLTQWRTNDFFWCIPHSGELHPSKFPKIVHFTPKGECCCFFRPFLHKIWPIFIGHYWCSGGPDTPVFPI